MNAERQVTPVSDERHEVVVQTDAASLMAVISRAASDPNTDVDKLERLMGLYERITDRSAKAEYSASLAEMQPKLPVVAERGSTDKGKYALWEDINDAIRPILAAHGFALSFRVGTATDGKMTVTGILSHKAGHQEETTMTLPLDTSGSKNAVQAVGSSTSYGKRYTALALLNITSRGEDDDGNGASGGFDARDMSGACEAAFAALNACNCRADITAWKAKHGGTLFDLMPREEANEVVRLCNQRFANLKA